ncbi:hypothetical protein ACJX0J_005956, partial [Zea mays]
MKNKTIIFMASLATKISEAFTLPHSECVNIMAWSYAGLFNRFNIISLEYENTPFQASINSPKVVFYSLTLRRSTIEQPENIKRNRHNMEGPT